MTEKRANGVRELRERALLEHSDRARSIAEFTEKHGGVHHRVNRIASRVTPENLAILVAAIDDEIQNRISPDAAILLSIRSYLKNYSFSDADEAGRDSRGFNLAVSELDVALCHLAADSANALRYLVYRYKFKMHPKEYRVGEFPLVLYVEASLACDLMCTMCYQSSPGLQEVIKHSSKLKMDWDLYVKIIDEAAANGLASIVFAGRGEPTLNPKFNDMIRYAYQKGIFDIKFNTNAMTPEKLYEKKVRDWLSLGAPLTVVFSVDAADKEGFQKIRIGALFERVIGNIRTSSEIRAREFPNSPVRTRISMTLFRDDQDPEAAKNLWGSLVDEFTAKNARSEQSGSIYQPNPDGTPKNVKPDGICRALFERLYIWCDGTVNPCEDDYLSKLAIGNVQIGNVHQNSIRELWNSPEMMRLRIAHLTGKKNTCYPCNGCRGF